MAVLHSSLGPHNSHLHLHAPPQASFQQIHAASVCALQYVEASSYSILIKSNLCKFTLWTPPCLRYPGPSPRSHGVWLTATNFLL